MKSIWFTVALCCVQIHTTTIKVGDLSNKNIEALRQHQKNNPGPLTIKVEGERPFINKLLGWGEWAADTTDSAAGNTNGWSIVKPFLQWALGGAVVSYGATFYLIYRTYTLLKTIGSWSHSIHNQDEEELLLYVRQIDKTVLQEKYLEDIKKEKKIIETYFKLHKYLCRWNMRHLFPYDKAAHASIVKSFTRLCALEGQLCKNNK
jgi:hypothetical protein